MKKGIVAGTLVALMSGLLPTGNSTNLAAAKAQGGGDATDVRFAKTTFTRLANGDQGIAGDIDWENFKVSHTDVGAKYKTFHDEPNHAAFRKAFITSFSKSFKGTGARAESVKNWKVKSKGGNQTVVSGETLSKSHLLITVSHRGRPKMSDIQNGP